MVCIVTDLLCAVFNPVRPVFQPVLAMPARYTSNGSTLILFRCFHLAFGIRSDTILCMKEHRHGDQVAATLRDARQSARMTLRELAHRAGTSHPTLSAYEQGLKVPSVVTFLRILEASGFAVDVRLSARIRAANGLDRGVELEQTLALAEQFPARHSSKLQYPIFG